MFKMCSHNRPLCECLDSIHSAVGVDERSTLIAMSEHVSIGEITPAFAWAAAELGLVRNGMVSREHLRTLGEFLARAGVVTPAPAMRASRKSGPTKKQVRSALTTTIGDYLMQFPGSTLEEVADALQVPLPEVTAASLPVNWLVLDEDELVQPAHRVESDAIAATRDRARAALQAASLMAKPLSHQAYTELIKSGRVKGPSVARIVQLFGSWTDACNLVGVESGQPLRNNYSRTWTNEQLIAFVERFLREPAYRGASHQFDEWRKTVNGTEKVPSLGTVRNMVGGTWNDIRTTTLRHMRAQWHQVAK